MMKAPNKKLIDELCWPSIRFINEELNIETLYCCQGRSKEDIGDHGFGAGYIAFPRTIEAFKLICYLLEKIKAQSKMSYVNSLLSIYFVIEEDELPSIEKLKQNWKKIEEILIEYKNKGD